MIKLSHPYYRFVNRNKLFFFETKKQVVRVGKQSKNHVEILSRSQYKMVINRMWLFLAILIASCLLRFKAVLVVSAGAFVIFAFNAAMVWLNVWLLFRGHTLMFLSPFSLLFLVLLQQKVSWKLPKNNICTYTFVSRFISLLKLNNRWSNGSIKGYWFPSCFIQIKEKSRVRNKQIRYYFVPLTHNILCGI